MALPASFQTIGFTSSVHARKRRNLPRLKRPGIMISTEGETNTGKTEFILSCPGPGLVLAVDRMYDGMLDNPNPPAARRDDFAFNEIMLATDTMAEDFKKNWQTYRDALMAAIKNPDALTVGIDGDSDTWETQRLADFGKLTQVPSFKYAGVNAARRALIARCFDSGKIIVATNKVKDEYVTKKDSSGNPVLLDGKEVRERSGNSVRQGFEDDNYLWHLQLRHLRKDAHYSKLLKRDIPLQFGIEILKSKSNPSLKGLQLWGDSCNFAGLVSVVYPDVELAEWGL